IGQAMQLRQPLHHLRVVEAPPLPVAQRDHRAVAALPRAQGFGRQSTEFGGGLDRVHAGECTTNVQALHVHRSNPRGPRLAPSPQPTVSTCTPRPASACSPPRWPWASRPRTPTPPPPAMPLPRPSRRAPPPPSSTP